MKKTDYIRIRLTPEEKQTIKEQAYKQGLSITDYIVALVNKDSKEAIYRYK